MNSVDKVASRFCKLVLAGIGVGFAAVITMTIMAFKDVETQQSQQPSLLTFGTVRVQNLDGVVYEYQGNNIHISEEDGEVRVIVDLPYHGDSCFTQPKFQDKMSMDWDAVDETLMLRFVEYISPEASVETKVWNILVILNRMLDENYPSTISEVIQQDLEQRGESLDFLSSIEITQSSIDAMELVKVYKWDVTGGSVMFQEVK